VYQTSSFDTAKSRLFPHCWIRTCVAKIRDPLTQGSRKAVRPMQQNVLLHSFGEVTKGGSTAEEVLFWFLRALQVGVRELIEMPGRT